MQLSENQKIFSQFFAEFQDSTQNLEYQEKQHALLGDFFLKLQTWKGRVT